MVLCSLEWWDISVTESLPQPRYLLLEYDREKPNCRTHSPSDGVVGEFVIIEEQGGELGVVRSVELIETRSFILANSASLGAVTALMVLP